MGNVERIYKSIVNNLTLAGQESNYRADADEPDARYKSYGVRANERKAIIRTHRKAIRELDFQEQMDLALRLIESEYGEQQKIALFILEPHYIYFSPARFAQLDGMVSYLHGWSSIDSYTGTLLRDVLFEYPEEMIELARRWNLDDDMWLRRASVVLFTRKVAQSSQFTDAALEFCEELVDDPELLVQKGVGWSLKDMMRSDKERILRYVMELRARGVSSVITLYAIKDIKGKERADILRKT